MGDVAAQARVSTATVSYVLNSTRKVREETRQRVLEAASKLGYSPNAFARNLAGGRSHILGLIVSDIRNPVFPEIVTAFQEAAALRGMVAIVMSTKYDAHRSRDYVSQLAELQTPGVAFLTSEVEPFVMAELRQRRISAVYQDVAQAGPFTSTIRVSYEQGIQAALEHLYGLGHRRVAFIGGSLTKESARERKQAYLEEAERLGLAARSVDSDFTVQGGYMACSQLLSAFQPSAILAANDLMAIGAMRCAYDRAVLVPKELSVVGFDDINFAQFTQPPLTTVVMPRSEIGRVAFEALWMMMHEASHEGREYRLQTSLSVRESTASPPASQREPASVDG